MENLKELHSFLKKECPQEGGCMLMMAERNGSPHFLVAERHKCANGEMFMINERMFYDYGFLWNGKWKIIYKYVHDVNGWEKDSEKTRKENNTYNRYNENCVTCVYCRATEPCWKANDPDVKAWINMEGKYADPKLACPEWYDEC